MPWTTKKNKSGGEMQWCVHKEGPDGKPMGASMGCHPSKAEADKQLAALYASDGKSLTIDELNAIKCWNEMGMEYVYVPMGVITLQAAFESEDAKENAKHLGHVVEMYKGVIDNIISDPDVDKVKAIKNAAAELAGLVEEIQAKGDEHAKSSGDLSGESAKVVNAGDYLVVEDKDGKKIYHLPVKKNGQLDHGLMGAAWAALHSGFRGNKYEGPDKDKAIAKLKKLYSQEKMDTPKSIPDYMLIKSLGNDRVGSYAVMWGDETRKDLTGEYFDQTTEELTAIFDTVGRLPYIYHHALDDVLKTRVIGVVDVLKGDAIGLWYEAQLKLVDEYDAYVKKLLSDSKLKTSSQTFPGARRVSKTGHIERWPIIEITATPMPAEYRMQPVEFLKSAFAEVGGDLDTIIKRYEETDQTQGAAKARAQLAIRRLRLLNL